MAYQNHYLNFKFTWQSAYCWNNYIIVIIWADLMSVMILTDHLLRIKDDHQTDYVLKRHITSSDIIIVQLRHGTSLNYTAVPGMATGGDS